MTTVIGIDGSVEQQSGGPGAQPGVARFPRQTRGAHVVRQSVEEQLHEVRASLAGVATAVRLLVHHDELLSEDRQGRLEAMLESELARLERLLVSSQPGDTRVESLTEVLDPVILARRLAGQVIHCWRSECLVECDRDSVAEVVNILLVNAARHAPGSPVLLEMVETADGVEVRVSDRGPGIPGEIRGRIFEPGFRGDEGGEHGIGLALARRLAEAQDGALFLKDAEGPGATFVLRVPGLPGPGG